MFGESIIMAQMDWWELLWILLGEENKHQNVSQRGDVGY